LSADGAERAREIFFEAVELPAEQRSPLLEDRCGNDESLRAEVESLLAHHQKAGGRMPPPDLVGTAATAAQSATAPIQQIGRYEIRREIASGGMGTVYEAVQDHPHRLVALKVLRHGAASRSAMKRFRHEAEILGRLRHPNIAQVYDAGTYDEGRGAQPYFAMELVKGEPLLAYAESNGLGTRERLDLIVKICDAVQYAHHKGVIHRDLKPDNVLVDDRGEPKILDFGVARATDSDIQATTIRTDIGQLIGTVPYMSPEQVTGDPTELDTRSDVYSLGVVLYELMCGRLPYDLKNRTIPDAVRVIQEDDPTPLSSVSSIHRGDVETIVAKALEKDKERRYQSPAELAADVRHFLADEPIVARPASTFYQLRKFARRNKILVGGVVAVFVVLVAGIIGIGIALAEARDEATRSSRIREFLESILISVDPLTSGDKDLSVVELLDQSVDRIDEQFADDPEVAISLHLTVARTYGGLGRLREYETAAQRAYNLGQERLGANHIETLNALDLLVNANFTQERFEEAIALARALYERRRRVRGATHSETIQALASLAVVLSWSRQEGEREEGLRLLMEAYAVSSQTHGPQDPRSVELGFSVSNALLRHYRFAEAEPYARSAFDLCRQQPSLEVNCDQLAVDLAVIIGLSGNPSEGARIAEGASGQLINDLGPNHPITLTSLYALGLNLQWSGRTEEAQRHFEEYKARSMESGYDFALPTFLLARLQWLEGELSAADARPLIEQLVERSTKPMIPILGELGLTALARCLVDLGEYEQADTLMQQNPGRLAAAVSTDHYERRLYLATLVAIKEGLGESDKAEEFRDLLRKAGGVKGPD
jgi:non-specific serine/threonine protein kinase/serine/threonine-protein kinase